MVCQKIVLTRLNAALLTPIPSASEMTASAVNPGERRKPRSTTRRSVGIVTPP
jgi:hypothetical protein